MGGNQGGKVNVADCPACGRKVKRFHKKWIHEEDNTPICQTLGHVSKGVGGGRG